MTEAVYSYDDYMRFDLPEQNPAQNPWDAALLQSYLLRLGASSPSVDTREADGLRKCYEALMRAYHGVPHGENMGQPYVPEPLCRLLTGFNKEEAEAATAIAGLFHDAVYKHVDADEAGNNAWPEFVTALISTVAKVSRTIEDGKVVFRTYLTGRDDDVTNMVAHIFDVGPNGIVHNQGGNEFDSALAAAKFLEAKGAPAKVIIAVTAMIAATVPFKPAKTVNAADSVIGDGHMGVLADRVKTATVASHDFVPTWDDVNDMMLLSVNLANRDIAPFILYDNFGAVIDNGRLVKKEEIEELRREVHTMRELARAAGRERSAPRLYELLSGASGLVSAADVPHFYIMRDHNGVLKDPERYAYPPLPVYEQGTVYAETNSRLGSIFFQAYEASVALITSIATLAREPDAEVPGFVHSETVAPLIEPRGGRYNDLDTEEHMVLAALLFGFGQRQVDKATPPRSPFGGLLFAVLGREGIASLSWLIGEIRRSAQVAGNDDPFCNPVIAKAFALEVQHRIGADNFWSVVHRLMDVAREFAHNPDRVARLGALSLA